VAEVTAERHVVAALGGGAVLREANRQAIRDAGWVVWLQAAPQTIRQRIENDPLSAGRRPNLTALEETEEISTLLQQRRPIYQQCADLAVETDGKTADEIANLIIELLHQGGFPSEPVRDDAD
jgi:shikimate kinase